MKEKGEGNVVGEKSGWRECFYLTKTHAENSREQLSEVATQNDECFSIDELNN